jgi:glycosyltransferase involved in cell wall biosynthesis
MKKILIIHTWGIGDLIMITPALISMKEQYQNLEIDFLFFQKSAALPIINGHLHRKIYYCDYNLANLFKTISMLNREKYDISFVTSGVKPWKAMLFMTFLKAKCKIGEYRTLKLFSFHSLVKYENTIHRLENTVKLVRAFLADFQIEQYKPTYFLTSQEIDFGKKWIKEDCPPNKKILGIHHGSNIKSKNRRWPYLYFIELIKKMSLKNFELREYIQQDELYANNKNADIYVSTSLSDGLSVSLLEAFTTKLFPIVSNIKVVRRVIKKKKNGRLFKVHDYLESANNHEYLETINYNYNWIINHQVLEENINIYQEYMNQVLSGKLIMYKIGQRILQ